MTMTTPAPVLPENTRAEGPVLWTCSAPGCRYKVHVPNAVTETRWRWSKPTIRNPKRKPVAKTTIVWPPAPVCPDHSFYRMKGGEIKGTYDPTVKCGDACTKAIGRTCRCACGGLRHGAG